MVLTFPSKFLREVEKGKNHPFALLTVEGAGQSDEATTEAHWTANTSESNVDYDSTPLPPSAGDVILAASASINTTTQKMPPTTEIYNTYQFGTWSSVDEWPTANDGDYLTRLFYHAADTITAWNRLYGLISASALETAIAEIPDLATIYSVRVLTRASASDTLSTRQANGYLMVNGTGSWSTRQSITASLVDYYFEWLLNPNTGLGWQRADLELITRVGCENYSIGPDSISHDHWCSQNYLEIRWLDFETSGNITVGLDLGASVNTLNNGVVSIGDNVPTNAGLTYTLEGSATGVWGGEEAALGSIVDGASVTGYRYYRPTANFTSDGSATPILKNIKIEIPDNIYRFTGNLNSKETLSLGLNAHPLITDVPGRTIELDLKTFVTKTSNLKVDMQRTAYIEEMLRTEYFKNLHVRIDHGYYFEGVTINDMILYYQGKVYNYALTDDTFDMTIKDASGDLSIKWPIGVAPATKPSEEFDGVHMVDVISIILDDIAVAARYINSQSLFDLKINSPSDSGIGIDPENWVVKRDSPSRLVEEAKPAKTYLTQLLGHLGAYLVVQEDGQIHTVIYDALTSPEETWDLNAIDKKATYDAGLKDLKNVVDVYYDNNGSGTELSDFASVYIVADVDSPVNWKETNRLIFKSEWIGGDFSDGYYGDEMAEYIATRESVRLSNGLGIVKIKTSLVKSHIQVGDFITLKSDLFIKPDIGRGDTFDFMAIKKLWNLKRNTITWTLMEAR